MLSEITELFKNRKIIGYGAGVTQLGTTLPLGSHLSYIVDDTEELHGKFLDGLKIKPSNVLADENKSEVFIIVNARTTSAVNAIFGNLESLGFNYMEHFIDCSYLHYFTISDKLKRHLNIETSFSRFEKIRKKTLSSDIVNSVPISGTWLIGELIEHLIPKVLGEIAELGVYFGGNSKILLDNLPKLHTRPYHLFDSFEGFPEITDSDKVHQDDFKDIDFKKVTKTFADYSNVQIHKGWFEDTLPKCKSNIFSFVHIDCDIYASTRTCIEHLSNKMSLNGVMLFHDCWYPNISLPEGCWLPYRGVKKAVDEFFPNSKIIVFPETMHALIKF